MNGKNEQSSPERPSTSLTIALTIVEDAWEELRRSPYVQQKLGVTPARLPDVSFGEAERKSEVGRSLLRRLDSLDQTALPHDLALTLRLVRFRALAWSREAQWYWTVVDPLGIGFFGLFLPAAYCGGWLLNIVHGQLTAFPFTEPGDTDRYLALAADYGRLIDQFADRTAEQAKRGIRIPKAQVSKARALLAAFRTQAHTALSVDPQRVASLPRTEHFFRALGNCTRERIEPAFDRVLEGLSDAYLAKAPDAVGIGQYPNGPQIYAELVRLHTTLNLTPDLIHSRGYERMTEIEASMGAIRAELGFEGNDTTFLDYMKQDSRWRASTAEELETVFQRYIDRLKPRFEDYFPTAPQATYGVAPLPRALEASMTYGYYDAPRPGRCHGTYLFNSTNLTQRTLIHIGALTYHELMPGHHLQFALQQENSALHPFRRHSFVNACNEGWAEYAAAFAGEIGLYELPEERYGRLTMDAFLTSRLVVDTGMNALGWSLERARDYMRCHSGMSESEIRTESLRYSCDIPGQALAYKLGDTQIHRLRERMRSAIGGRFDLREFHTVIIGAGTLPLSDLEWHLEYEIKRAQSALTEQAR